MRKAVTRKTREPDNGLQPPATGAELCRLMTVLGLTQQDVADVLGMTRQTVATWQRAEHLSRRTQIQLTQLGTAGTDRLTRLLLPLVERLLTLPDAELDRLTDAGRVSEPSEQDGGWRARLLVEADDQFSR